MTMTPALPPLQDQTFRLGLVLFAIALLSFTFIPRGGEDTASLAFFVVFLIFWIFLVGVFAENRSNYGSIWRFRNSRHNIILLQLANVSAYTLNLSIPVFHTSTSWLVAYLVFYHAILLLWCFRDNDEPSGTNYLILFTIATGVVFHLYQSIVVFPLYPIAAIAFWFFGIALLGLVPLWQLITAIRIAVKYFRTSETYRLTFIAGAIIPIVLIALYCWQWNKITTGMEVAIKQQDRPLNEQLLPPWITLAQDLPDDNFIPKILKGGWKYQMSDHVGLWGGRFAFMDEKREHDPFIVIASLFSGKLNMTDEQRINLLNNRYEQRNKTTMTTNSGSFSEIIKQRRQSDCVLP